MTNKIEMGELVRGRREKQYYLRLDKFNVEMMLKTEVGREKFMQWLITQVAHSLVE
jgi:hypothetical protein